jgi:hypothetical protein
MGVGQTTIDELDTILDSGEQGNVNYYGFSANKLLRLDRIDDAGDEGGKIGADACENRS